MAKSSHYNSYTVKLKRNKSFLLEKEEVYVSLAYTSSFHFPKHYCHEKRCLLLGRKVMTNLDSILKSKDITFPTKFCLVKAMVFPEVMYGCESWTIRKADAEELMLLNCGVGEDS